MAGTAADGQLRCAPPRERLRFIVATSQDDAAIRRLLRDNPMRGQITLSFEREPDYFAGAGIAGAVDQTILACDGSRLACMGRSTTRPCWVNGSVRPVTYLGELRLDAPARGRIDILRRGYEFYRELRGTIPAELTFTSIAADNMPARRLLERGLPELPRYSFLGGFVTLIIPVVKLHPGAVLDHHDAKADEIAAFLNEHGRRGQLGAAWSAEQLHALETHGLPLENFRVHRDGDGRILACGALWDQRGFRQTVIRGYAPPLNWARPAVNAWAALLGKPRWPAPGAIFAHAFLSPLAVEPDSERLLPQFIATLGNQAARRGIAYLTLGFAAGDARLAGLQKKFPTRSYASRLYRVDWPGEPALALDDRPLRPDVALL